MRTLSLTLMVLVASVAHAGGGPTRTAAEERDRELQERREAAQERAWQSQGKRAIPKLVAIACGNDALDLVDNAADALASHGASAARALYGYARPCGRYLPAYASRLGVAREELLASTYCAMAGRYEAPSPENAKELARWASVLADPEHKSHALAVDALVEVLTRPPDACDPKIFEPMLPGLTEIVATMPRTDHEHIAGTHRMSASVPRIEAAIGALGAARNEAATRTLAHLYDSADLRTKVIVVDALARSGPAGAAALPQTLAFLRLTRDDEARFTAVRALEAFEIALVAKDADVVADALVDLLASVTAPGGALAPNHNAWANLATTDAVRLLANANVAPASSAYRYLERSLAVPIAHHVREAAVRKLFVNHAAISPATLKCAMDTVAPQPHTPPTTSMVQNEPPVANAFGGAPVSFTPPASCR